jgi:hypothetical protein
MKLTQDRINNPPDDNYIQKWLDLAKEIGATHVALDQPMDNPKDNNSIDSTRHWLKFTRQRGLLVYHRHKALGIEGMYGHKKDPLQDYVKLSANYILHNPDFFKAGDLFAMPEPHLGGIVGVQECKPQSTCIFPSVSAFNKFLRDYVVATDKAFAQIGIKGKIKNGLFGLGGYEVAGLDNPDHIGTSIIEPETVKTLNNILAIDHYPDQPDDMETDLKTILNLWQGVKLFISEWGTINGETIDQMRQTLEVFRKFQVLGINYWHLGPGPAKATEALVNDDLSKRPAFYELQAWFTGKR